MLLKGRMKQSNCNSSFHSVRPSGPGGQLDGAQAATPKLSNLLQCRKGKIVSADLVEFEQCMALSGDLAKHGSHAMGSMTLRAPDQVVQGLAQLDFQLALKEGRSLIDSGGHVMDRDADFTFSVVHLPKSWHHPLIFRQRSVVNVNAAGGGQT